MRGAVSSAPSPDSAAPIASDSRNPTFRWPTLLAVLLWAAVSAVLLITTVPLRMPRAGLLGGGDDFDAYRDGVQHALAHLPLYSEPLIHQHLYTYPPFSAVAFLPFAMLPFGADTYIWFAVNVVVLVAVVAQCWRMLGYRMTPYLVCVSTLLAITCAFLEPVRSTLLHGQINLVLMLLVLWDTGRVEASRLKGIGVGIAAGIKLTAGYFILYYLALRQWRAAAMAVATFAGTVVVGWLALSNDSRQYWAGRLFSDSTRISDEPLHPSNQTLRGAIARITFGHPLSPIGPLAGKVPPTWLWLLTAVVVAVVSMWIVVRLYRAGERLLAVAITGLTATVVAPFSWTHHWVWFVPIIVYFVHRARTNSWSWLCALILFLAIGSWPYRFPRDIVPRIGLYMFPDDWVPWEVLANLYVLLYAVILIGAAVLAIRRTRAPRIEKEPAQSPSLETK